MDGGRAAGGTPTVSVLLNSYNQCAWLGQAINSVLAQTVTNLELIITDNGSTDASPEALAPYAADPRVKLRLCPHNAPVSQRLNEAVALATGAYICFLYSDDYYLPHKLERQLEALTGRDETWGVVYGPPLGLSERTNELWEYPSLAAEGWIFERMMSGLALGNIDMCTPLIRQSALKRHPFNEAVFNEGEAIFHRLALTHQFVHLKEPLVVLRDHDRNAGKEIVANARTLRVVLAALRVNPELKREQRALVDHYEADSMRMYGWSGARLGAELRWVRACYGVAVRLEARALLAPKTLAGLGLAALPPAVRHRLNLWGHRARTAPTYRVLVGSAGSDGEGYLGAVQRETGPPVPVAGSSSSRHWLPK